jgi:SAM-dependent methyltransferase
MSFDVIARAKLSAGASTEPIYAMVAEAVAETWPARGTLLDVGCGAGRLWKPLEPYFDRYVGADVVRYEGFPATGEFVLVDLDTGRVPLADAAADVVASVETIEHIENPRALVRELARLTKPGGLVVVTTPNQLSFLSKLSLVLLNEFSWFRGRNYPAHITALLEIDLRRMAVESGLATLGVRYSGQGRVPGVPFQYPRVFSKLFRRLLSDNVLLVARKPLAASDHQ